jgi:nitroreductase
MEEILKRRSIRQYMPDPVPDHVLKDLLRAAMAAPSAGNEQPWQFVVLRDRGLLDRIPSFHPHSHMVKQAPLAILICGDMELVGHGEMWVQDCSASTQNLLLAVQAKGLGAVWLGVYPRQERVDGFRKLIPMPQTIVPFSLVPIGYPAETKPPSDRFKESRIHYDSW